MATALSDGLTPKLTEEERRWIILGICLYKVLTPHLRNCLAKEIPSWYQSDCKPNYGIDKQTYKKYEKKLPPSNITLNYENVNNNFATHNKDVKKYDFSIKDPISLAMLFVKRFMAGFTGFNDTMDLSAVLSIIIEAKPFHTCGAVGLAKDVRDIRNEFAHCNYSYWTDANFQAGMQAINSLVMQLSFADKQACNDELKRWEEKGLQFCCGQEMDVNVLEVVQVAVSELSKTVNIWKNDMSSEQHEFVEKLKAVEDSLKTDIKSLREEQHSIKKDIVNLKEMYITTTDKLDALKKQVGKLSADQRQDVPNVFMPPKRAPWFSGRESELLALRKHFSENEKSEQVSIVRISNIERGG